MTLRFPRLFLAASLAALAAGIAQPAAAESYDQNCKPVAASDQTLDMEIAKGWPPIGFGLSVAGAGCRAHNFIKKLLTSEPDPDKITATQVFEASKPDVDPAMAASEHFKREREAEARMKAKAEERQRDYLRANPANEAVAAAAKRDEDARASGTPAETPPPRQGGLIAEFEKTATPKDTPAQPAGAEAPDEHGGNLVTLTPRNPNGFIEVFEGKAKPAAGEAGKPEDSKTLTGEGTLFSADGIEAGTFNKGELEGDGQEITPQGVWRGGNYRHGELEGPGFEVGRENGQPYAVEGEFHGDKPDGLTTVLLDGGASRRDLWGGGKRLAVGTVAAPGQTPAAPVYKSPQMLAAEADARILTTLKAAPNAGALYAMADKFNEDGDTAHAREAYRQLMTRFPDSPLAVRAADRLGGGGAPASSGPVQRTVPGGAAPRIALAGVGDFPVTTPVLPASFYDRYQGRGMAVDALRQMENSDPMLGRIAAQMAAATDNHLRMKYLIASLEGVIVIWRQAVMVQGGPEQINNWINQRNATIKSCQQTSSDPGDCLRPIQ